jgi:hypothetical protein
MDDNSSDDDNYSLKSLDTEVLDFNLPKEKNDIFEELKHQQQKLIYLLNNIYIEINEEAITEFIDLYYHEMTNVDYFELFLYVKEHNIMDFLESIIDKEFDNLLLFAKINSKQRLDKYKIYFFTNSIFKKFINYIEFDIEINISKFNKYNELIIIMDKDPHLFESNIFSTNDNTKLTFLEGLYMTKISNDIFDGVVKKMLSYNNAILYYCGEYDNGKTFNYLIDIFQHGFNYAKILMDNIKNTKYEKQLMLFQCQNNFNNIFSSYLKELCTSYDDEYNRNNFYYLLNYINNTDYEESFLLSKNKNKDNSLSSISKNNINLLIEFLNFVKNKYYLEELLKEDFIKYIPNNNFINKILEIEEIKNILYKKSENVKIIKHNIDNNKIIELNENQLSIALKNINLVNVKIKNFYSNLFCENVWNSFLNTKQKDNFKLIKNINNFKFNKLINTHKNSFVELIKINNHILFLENLNMKFYDIFILNCDEVELSKLLNSKKLYDLLIFFNNCNYINKFIDKYSDLIKLNYTREIHELTKLVSYYVERKSEIVIKCQICYDENNLCVLTNCGHICCFDCSNQIEKCSLCNKEKINVVKLFY